MIKVGNLNLLCRGVKKNKNHTITDFESVSKSQLYFMMRFTNKIFCCWSVIIVYDPKISKCPEELDYFTTHYLHYF